MLFCTRSRGLVGSVVDKRGRHAPRWANDSTRSGKGTHRRKAQARHALCLTRSGCATRSTSAARQSGSTSCPTCSRKHPCELSFELVTCLCWSLLSTLLLNLQVQAHRTQRHERTRYRHSTRTSDHLASTSKAGPRRRTTWHSSLIGLHLMLPCLLSCVSPLCACRACLTLPVSNLGHPNQNLPNAQCTITPQSSWIHDALLRKYYYRVDP